MTIEGFLFLLLFSAICGVVGQVIVGNVRGNVLAAILVGFIGAVLGTWLAASLGLPALFTVSTGGFSFPIVWSIIGAALLMGVVSMFSRRYYPY